MTAHRITEALQVPGASLLLDLDGTLVDSEPTHRAAFYTYFNRRGWEVSEEILLPFAGRRGSEVFAEIEGPWTGEDPVALAAEIVACVDHDAIPPVPVPGAGATIARWRRAGHPIALVTSSHREWATAALELLGVADLGLSMVTSEMVGAGKPDPEPYRRGAELLGADPAACIAFEDTTAGLTAAVGAGVGLVIGVRTSQSDEVLRAAGADATLPDLTSLIDVVQGASRTS
ncbi:HAD family phosphatase [Georgenia halophila]|uniref:HAD family phosphatase n=1 Tax=Georgenia halophila TaxID=620889 RepID=A0ABP8L533_9MICO